MPNQSRLARLQSGSDSRRSSISSVNSSSSSSSSNSNSSSEVSEPREIPSLEALDNIEKELKKIQKETKKKLNAFNIVPKVWLSFSKSKVLAQEQKAYDQKVSAFIECLKGYRSRLRKVHRDAKRRRMPVVDIIDIKVLDAAYLDLTSGRANAKRQLQAKHADYRLIFSALDDSLVGLSERLGNCFAMLDLPDAPDDIGSSTSTVQPGK